MDIRQPRLGIPSRGYCFLKAEIAALWTGSVKECSNGIKLKEKQLAKYLYELNLSSKVYPAFFDRSERTLNTHARLDELLHERNMTLYQLCQSGNIPYTTLRVSRCRGSQLSVDTIEQICRGAWNLNGGVFYSKQPSPYTLIAIVYLCSPNGISTKLLTLPSRIWS